MKSFFVVLAACGVFAQNLSGEPACATSCLTSAISAAGCSATDVACQCGPTETAIASLVAPCLLSSCNSSDLMVAESAGLALCSLYSATATTTAGNATATSATVTSVTATSATVTSANSTNGNLSTTRTSSTKSVATATLTSTATATGGSSSSSSSSSSSTAAAAPLGTAGPMVLGAGALVAVLGAMAAL